MPNARLHDPIVDAVPDRTLAVVQVVAHAVLTHLAVAAEGREQLREERLLPEPVWTAAHIQHIRGGLVVLAQHPSDQRILEDEAARRVVRAARHRAVRISPVLADRAQEPERPGLTGTL